MTGKRSSGRDRLWASRDRAIVPLNKTRARAMRRSLTDAERKLWWHLRHRLPLSGTHFRRQVRLGHYIVDFAGHGLKLVIELDGGQHAAQSARDQHVRGSWSPKVSRLTLLEQRRVDEY